MYNKSSPDRWHLLSCLFRATAGEATVILEKGTEHVRDEASDLFGLTIDIPVRVSKVGRAFHPHEQGLPRCYDYLTAPSASLLGIPC